MLLDCLHRLRINSLETQSYHSKFSRYALQDIMCSSDISTCHLFSQVLCFIKLHFVPIISHQRTKIHIKKVTTDTEFFFRKPNFYFKVDIVCTTKLQKYLGLFREIPILILIFFQHWLCILYYIAYFWFNSSIVLDETKKRNGVSLKTTTKKKFIAYVIFVHVNRLWFKMVS